MFCSIVTFKTINSPKLNFSGDVEQKNIEAEEAYTMALIYWKIKVDGFYLDYIFNYQFWVASYHFRNVAAPVPNIRATFCHGLKKSKMMKKPRKSLTLHWGK